MNKHLNLNLVAFFIVLIAATLLFFKVISPFIVDIFLAIILCDIYSKPYRYFTGQMKWKASNGALTVVLLALFSIVIPVIFVGIIVVNQSSKFLDLINKKLPELESLLYTDFVNDLMRRFNSISAFDVDIKAELNNFVTLFMTKFVEFTQATFVDITFIIFHFMIILILMFFLFIDGKKLLLKIQELSPLNDKDENELITKVMSVTDAIIWGTFMIGIMEGVFGTLLFLILGLDNPVFWGIMMTLLSMVPVLGANGVIVPAGIILILMGSTAPGIILLVVGVGGILLSQNIIKPRMVGQKIGMHPGIVLISMMGGLMWLGLIGFIIGPLLAAVCIVAWEQFAKRFKTELETWNKDS